MSIAVPESLVEVFESMDGTSDRVRVSMVPAQILDMIKLLEQIKHKISVEMESLSTELETATGARREAIVEQLEQGQRELAKGDQYLAEYNAMLDKACRTHATMTAIADIVSKSVSRALDCHFGYRGAQEGTVSLPDDE